MQQLVHVALVDKRHCHSNPASDCRIEDHSHVFEPALLKYPSVNVWYVDCEGSITSPLDDNIEALVQTPIPCTAANEHVRPELRGTPSNLLPTTANGLQDERGVETMMTIMNSASFDAMDKVGQPEVAPVAEDTGEDVTGIALDAESSSGGDLVGIGGAKDMEFIWDIGLPVGRHFDLEKRYLISICPGGIDMERSHLQIYVSIGLSVGVVSGAHNVDAKVFTYTCSLF